MLRRRGRRGQVEKEMAEEEENGGGRGGRSGCGVRGVEMNVEV